MADRQHVEGDAAGAEGTQEYPPGTEGYSPPAENRTSDEDGDGDGDTANRGPESGASVPAAELPGSETGDIEEAVPDAHVRNRQVNVKLRDPRSCAREPRR
jgi:hypothetical protein